MSVSFLSSVHHDPFGEWRHTLTDGRVCLRVRVARDTVDGITAKITSNYDAPHFFQKALEVPMEKAYTDETCDIWECVFTPKDRRIKYLFVIRRGRLTYKLDGAGLHRGKNALEAVSQAFAYAYAYPAQPMPEWARGCVGYQIFPDRFRHGGEQAGDEALEPWTSDRVQNEYRFGGNLRGMIDAVPYLKELGVTVVYTTPIFLSDTSHRYNTFDYYRVDPLLGTQEELRLLADTLHANGMRLVLDGVFNHCGLGFAPLRHALENGEQSPYHDWFFWTENEPWGYECFGHWQYMPKLNLANEECARYFLNVGKYWLQKADIDGWRLDVSPEVYPAFWQRFKKMMRTEKADSIMVAECWDDSREWLTRGDMFDSTMHYVLSRAIWERFCTQKLSVAAFAGAVNRAAALYPQRTEEVLWTFLGSHDTQRILTRAGENEALVRAASFFQFTFLGCPIIYYGDELAMIGADDPYCRYPMRWERAGKHPMWAHFRRLAQLRNAMPALRTGVFRLWRYDENGLFAYLRRTDTQTVLCVVNTGVNAIAPFALPLPDTLSSLTVLHEMLTGATLPIENGSVCLSLNAGEGVILQ